MTETYDYLKFGIHTTNRHADLNAIFKDWPKDRSVVLRVCRPHPEVELWVDRWLQKHANGLLKEGAVVEEPFALWLDMTKPKYEIALSQTEKPEATAQMFMADRLFWDIAARTTNIVAAFMTGKQIYVMSSADQELRDLAHMDKILELVHTSLLARGVSLAAVIG